MNMKVAYHKPNEKSLPYVLGGLYYYFEVAQIIERSQSKKEMTGVPHDFFRLSQASDSDQARFVRSLGPNDTVASNFGPYAHFYHYLREKYNGAFRIIREVQTSSWPAFWLQEYLAGPLMRDGDIVTFPSEFCRQYYIKLFPHFLSERNTSVCYAISVAYPDFVQRTEGKDGFLRVGYLGRISDDKNFNQVLSIFSKLLNDKSVKSRLYAAGSIESPTLNTKEGLSRKLAELNIPSDCFNYAGSLPHHKIWEFLGRIDVLLFPGLSAFESLGRVLIEASRARVRVVSAHYAAAPELLPWANLAGVHYNEGVEFDANSLISFGSVDENDMVEKIIVAEAGEDVSRYEQFNPAKLLRLVTGTAGIDKQPDLSPVVRNFINAVSVTGMDRITYDESIAACRRLFQFFSNYNNNSIRAHIKHLAAWTINRKLNDARKALYRLRSRYPLNRMLLGHGRQYCYEADFFPRITLRTKSEKS